MAKKLFVGNLSYEVNDENLKEAFEEFGTVVNAQVIKDRASGRSRGFGFVEMSSDEEARAAVAGLNDKEILGRKVGVSPAKERDRA